MPNETGMFQMPQRWMIYVSLLASLVAVGKTVFFSGNELGAMESHLAYDDKRLDSIDARFDRQEDKLESELQILRQSIGASQDAANRESQLLNELEKHLR